jgi:hypothetical protein
MHSQLAGLVIGLSLAGVSAWLWHCGILDEIAGSLLVGVGAAVTAAGIFAYLTPFNEPAFRRFLSLGIEYVWPSRQTIDYKYWVDQLSGAQETCILLGIAHGGWCKDERFAPTLHERLNHGLMVKMFFLNPESSAAELRSREEEKQKNGRDTREQIRKSIKIVWDLRQGLEPGLRERLRLYVYVATPGCGLTWIDRNMLVTHYLAGLPDVTSPALLLAPPEGGIEGSLFNTYAKNLAEIEKASILIVDENVHQFLPRAELGVQASGIAENRKGE